MTEEKVVVFEKEWLISPEDLDDPNQFNDDEVLIEKAILMHNEESDPYDMGVSEAHVKSVKYFEEQGLTNKTVDDLVQTIKFRIDEDTLDVFDLFFDLLTHTTKEERYKMLNENGDREVDFLEVDLSIVEDIDGIQTQLVKNIIFEKVEEKMKEEGLEDYLYVLN
jgi:uncharacterized lipoprotein YehR (DUF1307 family)